MPDHDELLRKTYNLALHNNKMIRKMRRDAFWGMVFKLVFWAVMLGIPLYLYFTILQPMLGDVLDTYAQLQQTGAQMQEAGTKLQVMSDAIPLEQLQGLLQNIPSVDFSGNSQ